MVVSWMTKVFGQPVGRTRIEKPGSLADVYTFHTSLPHDRVKRLMETAAVSKPGLVWKLRGGALDVVVPKQPTEYLCDCPDPACRRTRTVEYIKFTQRDHYFVCAEHVPSGARVVRRVNLGKDGYWCLIELED